MEPAVVCVVNIVDVAVVVNFGRVAGVMQPVVAEDARLGRVRVIWECSAWELTRAVRLSGWSISD